MKTVYLLIFIEKIVNANVEADPRKSLKKREYLFGVEVQKVWDTLPTEKIDIKRTEACLQEFCKIASQKEYVCVRALLNCCLVLLDYLKGVVPEHLDSLLNAEASILIILEEYDPLISDNASQTVGEEIANEILQHLEKLCTYP